MNCSYQDDRKTFKSLFLNLMELICVKPPKSRAPNYTYRAKDTTVSISDDDLLLGITGHIHTISRVDKAQLRV